MSVIEKFGIKLKVLRMKHRMKQKELCEKIGIPKERISRIEKNKTKIRETEIDKIINFFEVDKEYFK